jgi:hypothetical protein
MVGFKRGLLTITTKASASSLKESFNAEFFFLPGSLPWSSPSTRARERERERGELH